MSSAEFALHRPGNTEIQLRFEVKMVKLTTKLQPSIQYRSHNASICLHLGIEPSLPVFIAVKNLQTIPNGVKLDLAQFHTAGGRVAPVYAG